MEIGKCCLSEENPRDAKKKNPKLSQRSSVTMGCYTTVNYYSIFEAKNAISNLTHNHTPSGRATETLQR